MSSYDLNQQYLGSGVQTKGISGEPIPRGAVIYMSAIDGLWYRADSDALATMPAVGVSKELVATGRVFQILLVGIIGRGDWAWTRGDVLYVSGVAGTLTHVAPANAQPVAIALTTTMIYINPMLSVLGAAITGIIGDYTYLVEFTGGIYTVYNNQGTAVGVPGAVADVQINWALATGGAGCVVYLKESDTFTIVDPIVFTANGQVVRGGGRSSFVDGDGLGNNENAFEISGFTDCQIRNLSVQTQDGGGVTTHAIFIEDGADNFLIEDVMVVDSDSDGIHIEGTTITGGEIRNCKIAADEDGIHIDMDAGNYWYYPIIEENLVTDCGSEGMFLADLSGGVVTDNLIRVSGAEGIQLNLSTAVTVSGNISLTNVMHGIGLTDSDSCLVEDNVCMLNDSDDIAAYDGINIDATSTDNVINGNMTNLNHRFGIGIQGARNVVTSNKVSTNDRHGIYIAAAHCQVEDNDCYNNGQDSAGNFHEIALTSDADYCMIHNNHATSDGTISEDCIHLADGATAATIMGNYCYNGMGSGIALTANNDVCSIIGNRCIDNDDYGIEITAATCNDTRVKENHLDGNVTGQFLDNGTDTQTPWFFAPVSDPNVTLGDHPGIDLPDDTDTNVYAQILVPLEFQELVTCSIIVVAAATGDLVWTVDTDFGKICASEAYNTHTDSGGATEAITIDLLSCLDITAALTNIAGGDLVGVNFVRDGDAVDDTIGDSVYYLGIRMRYV